MEPPGVNVNDDDKNSYCVMFEIMISSSLVEECKPFGAIIYP
jgi:hypothetical protein